MVTRYIKKNLELGIIEWVKTSRGWEIYVKQFKEEDATRPPNTWWICDDVGHNHEAKEEARQFNSDDIFSTPKPEKLIERILTIATNPGDLILDSFAGSGTTGAVAHKMHRCWIMIELGEHCHTHIIPRLQKVIDGTDAGGITKNVNWEGGGGFRYFRLAPSLMEKDQWGNWIINRSYNSIMLAEALCKLEGFTFAPAATCYWKHGYSTERDFIYVTTGIITLEHLQYLAAQVGTEYSLLIMCTAFRADVNDYPNLTLKKIPQTVLTKCEWGHDDYSLKVENLPQAPLKPGQIQLL